MARSYSSGDANQCNMMVIRQSDKLYSAKQSSKEGETCDTSKQRQHVEIPLKKESTIINHSNPNSILQALIEYHDGRTWVRITASPPPPTPTALSAASTPVTSSQVSAGSNAPRVYFWLKRQDRQKDRLCFHFGSAILFTSQPFVHIKVFYIHDDTQYIQFTIHKKFRQVNWLHACAVGRR